MFSVYTICTPDYLPYSRVTIESFLLSNPNYSFHLFFTEDSSLENDLFADERIIIHFVEKLQLEELESVKKKYNVFEYCNALKPFLAHWLLNNFPIEKLIYSDSDMMYFGRVTDVETLLEMNNFILTPHICKPIPIDHKKHDEQDFLRAGIFNGGFFAIKKSHDSLLILEWWKERMKHYCFNDQPKGLFVDQIWLNLVPLLFEGVIVLKNLGYNMGPWNLSERRLSYDGKFMVNESEQLICYHYSGYRYNRPEILSKYQNRYSFEQRKDLIQLYQLYYDELISKGVSENYTESNFQERKFERIKHKIINKIKTILNHQ